MPANGGATALAGLIDVPLELDADIFAPHAEVRLAAKKGLTKRDETRDVENRVGGKMVELQTVEVR